MAESVAVEIMDPFEVNDDLKSTVLALLTERDKLQRDPYIAAFDNCAFLAKSNDALRRRNKDLVQRMSELQDDVARLRLTGGDTVMARMSQLEKKCAELQEEQLKLYKEKAELASSQLRQQQEMQTAAARATETQIALEEELQSTRQELDELKLSSAEEIRRLREELEDTKQVAASKDVLISVIHKEMEALKEVAQKSEEEANKVKLEHEALLQRYLKRVEQEASLMNMLQEQATSKHADQRRQHNVARAVQEVGGRISMSADLLDPGSGLGVSVVPTQVARDWNGSDTEINCIGFSPNGQSVAIGDGNSVKLFSVRTGSSEGSLRGATQSVMSVSFSPDGSQILGACNDQAARLWDLHTQRIVHTFTGHTNRVVTAAFLSDNKSVITGSHDRVIILWDIMSGKRLKSLHCTSTCTAVSPSSDGGFVLSGHFDGKIRLWTIKEGEVSLDKALHDREITSIHLSPDRNCLLTNSVDGTLKLLDTRTLDVVRVFSAETHKNNIKHSKAGFSSDGRYVACGSAGGVIHIWDTASGKVESVLKCSEHKKSDVVAVSWDPQGIQFASVDKQKCVVIWE